jgi:hypothetical protein
MQNNLKVKKQQNPVERLRCPSRKINNPAENMIFQLFIKIYGKKGKKKTTQ